ncbi:MAG: mechanosensitive ion channel [Kistimonas sp.]|nr:mechanosensitive ion channel [Kistimonas sp.]
MRKLILSMWVYACFLTPFSWALGLPSSPVSRDEIARELERIKSADSNQAETSPELSLQYGQVMDWLKKADEEQEQLDSLNTHLAQAPKELPRLQRELDEFQMPSDTQLLEQYRHLPLDQLHSRLDSQLEMVEERKSQLERAANQVTLSRARPEKNQAVISRNQERLKTISGHKEELEAVEAPSRSDKVQWLLLQAEASALQVQVSRLSLEIRSSSTLLELETLRQQWLVRTVQLLDQEVLSLQTIINFKRRAASEQAVATASRLNRSAADKAILQDLAAQNMVLSQQLLSVSDRLNDVSSRSTRARNQLGKVQSIQQAVRQQSALLGENYVLAHMLRENLKLLPQIVPDQAIQSVIAQARLEKFQYDQKRQELGSPDAWVQGRLSQQADGQTLNDRDKKELQRLARNRQQLLESLSFELGSLLGLATSLAIDQQSLSGRSRELSDTLERRLFWLASNRPLGVDWLASLPGQSWQQLVNMPWKSLSDVWWESVRSYGALIAALLGFSFFVRKKRGFLADVQGQLNSRLGNVHRDSLLLTPGVLGLSLLRCLPLPALLFFLALPLLYADGFRFAGHGLMATALLCLLMFTAVDIQRPVVTVSHFRWPREKCPGARRLLGQLQLVTLPLFCVAALARGQSADLNYDVLGAVFFSLAPFVQAWVLFRLMRSGRHFLGSRMLRQVFGGALVLVAMIQPVLTVMGYYYTALYLQMQLVVTLCLVGGAILVQALVLRSLHVAERRLAFTRALRKRAASQDGENLEVPNLDLATISKQSLRLVNSLMLVGVLIGLFWLWKDLFSFLNVLDSVTLWELAVESQGGQPVPVLLSDLILALITLAASFILARNLPGLLEVTVLSRLKLRTGSSYAITTLLSYMITCVGVIVALGLLGASWGKLQWLVAALGLGIGIGLQEVVANFVAGLIILFERPVRIGDTITLGEVNGEVSRIRIRSTTIVDWDNREIIVPNKILMGEKLINWSLSSSVVRIILRFRVIHDSDVRLIHKLLHQAASENGRVVAQPETLVVLMDYGESALEFELRTYVVHVHDRMPVRDQLNSRIKELFTEHGVVVACPRQQVTLHMDSQSAS